MADRIITLQTIDGAKKPTTEILLIPQFKTDRKQKTLYPKLEQNLVNKILNRAKQISFKSKKGESFILHDTGNLTDYDALLIFGMGKAKNIDEDRIRETMAKVFREVASLKFTSVAMYIPNEITLPGYEIGKAISEALYLSQYRFDTYKSAETKKKKTKISVVTIYKEQKATVKKWSAEFERGVEYGRIVSDAVNMTRNMVNEPGQYMYPEVLTKHASEIVKNSKGTITMQVLDEAECRKLGMGAYLAVSQGSEYKPQFIVLHYSARTPTFAKASAGKSTSHTNSVTSKKITSTKICLIGKSITFDTGGLSLKPSKSMETMKLDMAGGATVLGVFKILSTLKNVSNLDVYGILPACENSLSGKSIRPGDIVHTLNGTSIEILNTDAEGRLALADALSYAEKYLKPDYIIDIATLTGAVMVALGPDMTGLFANNNDLKNAIKKAAKVEGEAIWPLPLYKPYAKKMKSDFADLKNITGMGYGGAITAALFLQEFVKNAKWAHLDIAGSSFNEDGINGTIPKGGTGWGVRTLVRLLETM